jgi:ATP-binding protein involved in chromosome partitioning
VQKGVEPIKGIKNIIAVASGKGGVGKSTTAVNLALALSAEGAKVGILDADIYGPSQPRMLGVRQARIQGRQEPGADEQLPPAGHVHRLPGRRGDADDLARPDGHPGPGATAQRHQLVGPRLSVIDLPPGTGDTQLTLAQKVPVSGAVIVTTPQDIALLDARKGLKMFQKVEVPVLGIVENMSTTSARTAATKSTSSARAAARRMSEQYDVDFLGALPLDIRIREETDNGKPTVVAEPESRIAQIYRDIARRTAAKLSLQAKDYAAKFPKIVIQNN